MAGYSGIANGELPIANCENEWSRPGRRIEFSIGHLPFGI